MRHRYQAPGSRWSNTNHDDDARDRNFADTVLSRAETGVVASA